MALDAPKINKEDSQRVTDTERGKSISGSHHFMNVFRKVEFQNNRERGWREERGGWASCCFVTHSRMSSENGEYAYHVGVVQLC